jgi:hypothetical protein
LEIANPALRSHRIITVASIAAAFTLASWLPVVPGPSSTATTPETVERRIRVRLEEVLPPGSFSVVENRRVRIRNRSTSTPTVMCPPIRFTAIGLTWLQRGRGEVVARVAVGPSRSRLTAPTELHPLDEGPDRTSPEHTGRSATELLWTGTQRCVRVTVTVPGGATLSESLDIVFINSSGTAHGDPPRESALGAHSGGGGLFGASSAEAATRKPPIITRSKWGARESLRKCGPMYAPAVRVAFVHHTANSNSYSKSESDDIVRAIYRYHTQTKGWCDIAYSFLVDRFGQIFEGRYGGMQRPVVPAATLGFNSGSTAVAAIGNFQRAGPPSAMVTSISRLLAWRMDVAHVSPLASVTLESTGSTGGKYPAGKKVKFRTVAAHRDAGYTDCPGDYLYSKFGSIRRSAYETGLPKMYSLTQSTSSFVPGQGSVTWTGKGSQILRWRMEIRNQSGELVKSSPRQRGSTFFWMWDGRLDSGVAASPGAYTTKLTAWSGRNTARPATFRITLGSPPP